MIPRTLSVQEQRYRRSELVLRLFRVARMPSSCHVRAASASPPPTPPLRPARNSALDRVKYLNASGRFARLSRRLLRENRDPSADVTSVRPPRPPPKGRVATQSAAPLMAPCDLPHSAAVTEAGARNAVAAATATAEAALCPLTDELPFGSLSLLPAHLVLEVLASGFLEPRDLAALRRTCQGLCLAHPCSSLRLSLPSEAARILFVANAPSESDAPPGCAAAAVCTAGASGGAPGAAVVGGTGDAAAACADVDVGAGAGAGAGADHGEWVSRLHRSLQVPRKWLQLTSHMERRAVHRTQLVQWAQRYMQMRHARAMSNLATLMSRVRSLV